MSRCPSQRWALSWKQRATERGKLIHDAGSPSCTASRNDAQTEKKKMQLGSRACLDCWYNISYKYGVLRACITICLAPAWIDYMLHITATS